MLRVFENRVVRKIFGSKRNKGTGEWRKLHNEELCDLYCSPNIIRLTKSRRLIWAEYVAHTGERRGAYRVLMERGDHLEDLGVDGLIIIRFSSRGI
jgi:hypothetical protein